MLRGRFPSHISGSACHSAYWPCSRSGPACVGRLKTFSCKRHSSPICTTHTHNSAHVGTALHTAIPASFNRGAVYEGAAQLRARWTARRSTRALAFTIVDRLSRLPPTHTLVTVASSAKRNKCGNSNEQRNRGCRCRGSWLSCVRTRRPLH